LVGEDEGKPNASGTDMDDDKGGDKVRSACSPLTLKLSEDEDGEGGTEEGLTDGAALG
jgi:hypothetical protein